MLKIALVTVSDRAFRGEYEDFSGPAVRDIIMAGGIDPKPLLTVVPDDPALIRNALLEKLDYDYIITIGGTGISPRDITPDVTRDICDREIPGIAEWIRSRSLDQTPYAILSRGFAGVRDRTIIINFPGSVAGARFCANLILPVLEHGKAMLLGKKH